MRKDRRIESRLVKSVMVYLVVDSLTKICTLDSVGTTDYTDGEDVRPNHLKGQSSVKSEIHKSLICG